MHVKLHQDMAEAYRNDFAQRERSVPSLAAAPEAPCITSISMRDEKDVSKTGFSSRTAPRQASASHRLLVRPVPR